jgi:hypothetical protein
MHKATAVQTLADARYNEPAALTLAAFTHCYMYTSRMLQFPQRFNLLPTYRLCFKLGKVCCVVALCCIDHAVTTYPTQPLYFVVSHIERPGLDLMPSLKLGTEPFKA